MVSSIRLAPKTQTYKCIPRGDGNVRQLTTDEDLVFQAFSWDVQDVGFTEPGPSGEDEREHTIFISGVREDGHSVTVETAYHPYFMLKLGYVNDERRRWTRSQIQGLIDEEVLFTYNKNNKPRPRTYYFAPELEDEDGLTAEDIKEEKRERAVRYSFQSSFVQWEELLLHDLDAGFTGKVPKKFQFVKLEFRTECAAKACARLFTNDGFLARARKRKQQVKLYEANLDSHMRLMHLTECQSAGWIRLPAKTYEFCLDQNERRSSSDVEIKLPKWQDMKPYDHESIAPLRECSFDLETYSPEDDKFSNAEVRDNYIIQIASTFSDFGTGRCMRVLYCYKGIDPIEEPNTIVKCFETERQMLLDWSELISASDPETVHAYNGWEFDYGYLANRAKVNKCWDEFRSKLGRITTIKSRLIVKEMSSKAYGDNFWKLLTMSGRVVFDPMVHIQREFKLNFYNLKSVSEEFLSQKLNENPFTTTKGSRKLIVRHPNHGLSRQQVIHFSDIDTPDICVDANEDKIFYALAGWDYDVLHDLHTITSVISPDEYVIEMPTPANKSLQKAGGSSVKAFETKHDISFPVMFRAWREQDTKILRDVGRYCIQDTLLPQKILDKLCVIPNLIEMAKCTWVPLEYLITRGQQIKVFSQICKASREEGYAVPTIQRQNPSETDENDEDEEESQGFIGGAVLEPFVGYYDEPVAVPDFKSLYPCTMIDNNLCFTTLVKDKKYLNEPDTQYNQITVGNRINTFAMDYDGIVPKILVNLLNARDHRKKLMGAAKTPLERMIHNGAQLALKVSANSIYGFMGVSPEKAMLPCMEIAESTTSKGRDGTFTSRDFAENPENFKDIVQCDHHFPLNYPYLMKNAKGKCFHLTAEKLLKVYKISLKPITYEDDEIRYLSIQEPTSPDSDGWTLPIDGPSFGMNVWTDAQWDDVTGVSRVRRDYIDGDLIRFHTTKGKTLDMQNFKTRILNGAAQKTPVKKRNVEEAIQLSKENICSVVYGDTDSIFVLYDSTHLKHLGQPMRVAYCGIVAAFVADRITDHLRSQNPFKPKEKQWMELEYEKTYRCFILFSKKRYSGEMTEFDPFSYTNDNKGTSKKRRDFCSFVKEVYGKIIKELFSEDESLDRNARINSALEVVKKAVQDLLNNRVPFNKLVISKLLKSHYAVRNKVQSKDLKGCCSFHKFNIFIDDKIIVRIGIQGKTYSCECQVIAKNDEKVTTVGTQPLTVRITSVQGLEEGQTAPAFIAINSVHPINYSDVHEKLSSTMYLEKIMDPNTSEEELEPIKQAHVRLARKMNLRDPATAPPSGTRVGYVFCESKNKNDLQYLKAESPDYAIAQKMKVDPIYYLEKQCANAWSQILDTVQPGLIGEILAEAYSKYNNRLAGQPEIASFLRGGGGDKSKNIAIEAKPKVDKTVIAKKKKASSKKAPLVKGANSIAFYFQKK